MDNNDIFRKLRYAFDYSDTEVIHIFSLTEVEVTRAQISDWLKRDDDPAFRKMSDLFLAIFLNGLIIKNRGLKDGVIPQPESVIDNNIILRKLRIALNLRDEDMIAILASSDFRISKHELSAFFRKPEQSQYRKCHDQILRNFLNGLQLKYRK